LYTASSRSGVRGMFDAPGATSFVVLKVALSLRSRRCKFPTSSKVVAAASATWNWFVRSWSCVACQVSGVGVGVVCSGGAVGVVSSCAALCAAGVTGGVVDEVAGRVSFSWISLSSLPWRTRSFEMYFCGGGARPGGSVRSGVAGSLAAAAPSAGGVAAAASAAGSESELITAAAASGAACVNYSLVLRTPRCDLSQLQSSSQLNWPISKQVMQKGNQLRKRNETLINYNTD
jgi:hypothetical protein